jgi:nicotinamide riboside kinase
MAEQDVGMGVVEMVVFVGAESTGKSTLAEHLAREFDTVFVPEIGRFIWEEKKGQLTVDDYVDIAVKHRQAEAEAMARAQRYLFVDTSALTTLLLGYCFGHIQQAPVELLRYADECKHRYAHHFVCADDIPYEYDPARENEAWRGRIQKLVLEDLEARGIPYTILRGSIQDRVAQVRRVLEPASGKGRGSCRS